jgi:hypothetical protein
MTCNRKQTKPQKLRNLQLAMKVVRIHILLVSEGNQQTKLFSEEILETGLVDIYKYRNDL